jgi:hypothetical protein
MILMLAVTAFVFYVIYNAVGIIGAIIGSLIFFAGWFLFNIYSGSEGMIKANLKAYLAAREYGSEHKDALKAMADTRYRNNPERLSRALRDIELSGDEKQDILNLILTMSSIENNRNPPVELIMKISAKFDKIYESLSVERST